MKKYIIGIVLFFIFKKMFKTPFQQIKENNVQSESDTDEAMHIKKVVPTVRDQIYLSTLPTNSICD